MAFLSLHDTVYNLLIFLGSVFSFIAWRRGYKHYLILSVLLFITTAMEVYVQFLVKKDIDFTWLYHSFALIEYPFFCWFLLKAVKSEKIQRVMKISIPLFIVANLAISIFYYHFQDFPGLNVELEGLLQLILCTYVLFNLEVEDNQPILKNQYFWICSGILIFYGTTFFFNGVYTKILNINSDKAMELFSMINKPLNLVMYAFIIIGILCLLTSRKPISQ